MPIKYGGMDYDLDVDLYSGADPVYIRPRRGIPISYWRHWYRSLVADTNAIDTTVAVRHNNTDTTRAYIGYVGSDNVLVVKSAELTPYAFDMDWEVEETIPGCIACSVEFDGNFQRDPADSQRTLFITDSTPWLFYVTTDGAMYGGILGGSYEILAAAGVTSVDATKGVASPMRDIDQGLVVFYPVYGEVKHNNYVNGAWQGQETVSIAPANAVALRVERSFDWRIILHVRDNTGALYEVMTRQTISSNINYERLTADIAMLVDTHEVAYTDLQEIENITALADMAVHTHWGLPPVVVGIENIDDGNGDYGWKVRITFDELVFSVTGNDLAFTITDDEDVVWNSTAVEQVGDKVIVVTFQNWNNAEGDVTVAYAPGTIIGEVELVEAFSETFTPTGLVPTYVPPPVPVAITNPDTLTVRIEFDRDVVVLGAAAGFAVSYLEPAWVPGGANVLKTYTPTAVSHPDPEVTAVDVSIGDAVQDDTQIIADELVLQGAE